MIPLPVVNPLLLRLGLIAAACAACYIKGCSDEKERFDSYKQVVKAVGEAQEARTRERIAADKLRKKETDDAHQIALAAVRRDRERLRRDLAGRSFLPPATPAAGSPARITFDRAELDRALGEFARGAAEIAGEGDEAREGLNAGRRWARGD